MTQFLKLILLDAGIDPRVNDLRPTSNTGTATGTAATTPDNDKPDDAENLDEGEEGEEAEGELRDCETNFLTIPTNRV